MASVSRVEFSYLRVLGHRRGRHLSGNASFNFGDGELINRVLSRLQPEYFASRRFVVAGRFCAGGVLLHLHLATVRRKSERPARHSRFLLGVLMIYVHSLGRAARYFPERTALAANGTRSTFRELHDRIGRIAAALTKHGFKAGVSLSILLPNEPYYIELVYACARLGITAVPLNPRLSVKEIDRILGDAT